MLVLAVDTATAATAVAVVACAEGDGHAADRVLAERVEIAANRHGELVAPLVRQCLRDAGAGAGSLGLVAVGTGPGPFTGLRVGLVTARAMADALGIGVRGVCSLDVVAAAHRGGGPVAVVTDARRREVYWASYDDTGRRVAGPAVERPAVLAERLGAGDDRPLLVGPGAQLYRDVFAGFAVRDADAYPRPVLLARLALDPAAAGPPEPLYLRRPDARPPGPRKLVTSA